MPLVRRHVLPIALLALFAINLLACTPGGQSGSLPAATVPGATPTPVPPTATGGIAGEAVVESVEIVMLESFPVQVKVVAKGYVPDACTTIGEIKQERTDSTFKVTIPTVRPADKACAEVITPFEETINLDVAGLKAGTYTVTVNGVSQTFTLSADNIQP